MCENPKRWVLADADLGYMFRVNGRWRNTETFCHNANNSATTSVFPRDTGAAPYREMAVGQPNHALDLPMSPCE